MSDALNVTWGRKRKRCDLSQHPLHFTTATVLSVTEWTRRHMSPHCRYGNDKRTDESLYTCKYNKQTAGLHTHTKWVSVARQDHGRQHTQKQHCSFCTTKCVHIHRPILVHISETTTKRWCIQPCYTKLTMLRWEKSLELVTLGTVVWHHITA